MTPLKPLGKYEILGEIGRGGFAAVYRARDTALDRVAGRVKTAFAGDAETQALRRAWEAAFAATLGEVAVDLTRDQFNLLDDILRQFVAADGVAGALLVLAQVPTLTTVSRQALISGRRPLEFAATLDTTDREPEGWASFWATEAA